MASRRVLLGLGALLAMLLSTPMAHAQIVREKPAQVKAANRRALREVKHADVPYKDSHLDVTRGHLKRGQSNQPLPEGRDELRYKTGTAPNVQPAGFLGLRHKKKYF